MKIAIFSAILVMSTLSASAAEYKEAFTCTFKEKLGNQITKTMTASLLIAREGNVGLLLISETIDRYQGASFTNQKDWISGTVEVTESGIDFIDDGYEALDRRSALRISKNGKGRIRLLTSEGHTRTVTTPASGIEVDCRHEH